MDSPLISNEDFSDVLQMLAIPLGMKLQLITQRSALRPANLTVQEWRFLLSLSRFGASHLRLITKRAALDPAHASRTAALLEKRGLVKRRVDQKDNRKRLFSLTSKGAELVGQVWPVSRKSAERFRALYSEKEFETLMSLLQRALDQADRMLEGNDDDPSALQREG